NHTSRGIKSKSPKVINPSLNRWIADFITNLDQAANVRALRTLGLYDYNIDMLSRLVRAGVFTVLAILLLPVVAHAQLSSPNYNVDEVFIGSGGELELCSDDYCAQ